MHDYAHLLKEANLHLLKIAKIQTADPFVDREEFLNFLLGTFNPAVPKSKAHEFYDEVITEYLRLLPEAIDEKGLIEARFGRIEIEAAYTETH